MVDVSELSAVTERYPAVFRPTALPKEPVSGGFSGALVFRTRCAAGDFCLRGWPPGNLPVERVRGLHRLLEFVFARGCAQVAVPVRSVDGGTVVAGAERLWQLEPWMPGTADYHLKPSRERLTAAMRALAHWHRAAAQFDARAEERRWFARGVGNSPAVTERLELMQQWMGGRLEQLRSAVMASAPSEVGDLALRISEAFARSAPTIAGELQSAKGVQVPLQPCLRDVWHDHVLFSGDEVTGLIDASACRTESVAADLARLLGSLVGDDFEAWELALQRYQEERPLTADEQGLVTILDRSGVALSAMTWLEWLFLERRVYAPMEPVLNRLRMLERRLETIVRSL